MPRDRRFSRLTLTFERDLENEFRSDYAEKSVWHVRAAIAVVALLWSAFGLMDPWVIPESMAAVWVVRYGIVAPLLAAVFLLTYSRRFARLMQPAMAAVYLACAFGFLAMIVIVHPPGDILYPDYAGLMLCAMLGHTALRLRFVYATGVSCLVILGYVLQAVWLRGMPGQYLVHNTFHILAAVILGMIGGYTMEVYIRRDFLQRRAAERSVEQLELVSSHKSRFLASMSHELRTPLNAIIGFSEILLDPSLTVKEDERTQFLSDILNSGKHLLKLINEVLDLARIEAGRMELQIEAASLTEILDTVHSTVRPLAAKNRIDLHVAPDGAIPPFPMDAGRVTQVVLNLVGNAIKFTPADGRVWVRATTADGHAVVEVGDTGPGIAAEDRERIFLEFQQAQSDGNVEKPEGTGLGLALARKFVDMHGGALWVESEVGKGSRFFFTLPMNRR